MIPRFFGGSKFFQMLLRKTTLFGVIMISPLPSTAPAKAASQSLSRSRISYFAASRAVVHGVHRLYFAERLFEIYL